MIEKIKAWVPLNFALISNPANWIIVFLMVAIAGVGIAFITQSTDTPTEENE